MLLIVVTLEVSQLLTSGKSRPNFGNIKLPQNFINVSFIVVTADVSHFATSGEILSFTMYLPVSAKVPSRDKT